MSWITEHPTGVYIVLGFIGGFSLLVFLTTRRVAHLSGLGVAVALIVLVALIDRLVVTDREQVEINALSLAKAAQEGDLAALDRLFSDRFTMDGHTKDSLLSRARSCLVPGALRTIQFWSLEVPPSGSPNQLQCRCNASASGNFGQYGNIDPPYIGTLQIFFEKEGDQWRVTRLVVRNLGGYEQRIP
jgi:hypothetical protein